jgi:lipid II:glycine glycyltransferase (peptidoglycan interpeptide bridge formation enzyme)
MMANKALAKRQKLTIRSEPSPKSLKAHNPFAAAAKQRAAGTQRKGTSAEHPLHKILAKRLAGFTDGESQ